MNVTIYKKVMKTIWVYVTQVITEKHERRLQASTLFSV
jgi:hypothetical protein